MEGPLILNRHGSFDEDVRHIYEMEKIRMCFNRMNITYVYCVAIKKFNNKPVLSSDFSLISETQL